MAWRSTLPSLQSVTQVHATQAGAEWLVKVPNTRREGRRHRIQHLEQLTYHDTTRAQAQPYRWDLFQDGAVWVVEQGIDYHTPTATLSSTLSTRDKVIVRTLTPTAVAFQFVGDRTTADMEV
jgi:hypothetical protein